MITKKEFCEFIKSYQEFQDNIDKFDMAITGKNYPTILFETNWYEANGKMLDIFLDSHFTEEGCELITWWLFEDLDHIIYETPDLFSQGQKVEYDVNNIEDLWNYLIINKEIYFK